MINIFLTWATRDSIKETLDILIVATLIFSYIYCTFVDGYIDRHGDAYPTSILLDKIATAIEIIDLIVIILGLAVLSAQVYMQI